MMSMPCRCFGALWNGFLGIILSGLWSVLILTCQVLTNCLSSRKCKDNGHNFLLYSPIAGLWLWQRPNSIGKESTLLDEGSAEGQAARRHHTVWQVFYLEMILRLTTQIKKPYCTSEAKTVKPRITRSTLTNRPCEWKIFSLITSKS